MNKNNKYLDSMEKAVEWLIEKQNEDGSLYPAEKGISTYYKATFALVSRGRTMEALKLFNWVRDKVQTKNGDFKGPYPRGMHDSIYPYSNSWIIFAAHRLGQFDISNKGIEFLLKLQDSDSGGFFSELDSGSDKTKNGDEGVYGKQEQITTEGIMDTMCSAMAGLACIQTGKIEEAKLAAKFFKKVYEEQPDPENIFYVVYHNETGLVTEFPSDDSKGYAINVESTKQNYFNLGIAAAFLTSLSMATGDQNYLKLAQKYINYINRCASDRFTTPQSGKIGWGAAYLALITGNEEYKEMALKVADYLVDAQEEEGCWHNVGPNEDVSVTMSVTAEFVSLLNEMMRALV